MSTFQILVLVLIAGGVWYARKHHLTAKQAGAELLAEIKKLTGGAK